MFLATMPWVILINIISLIWFICLQYFRFKDTGRACSGDFSLKSGFGNLFVNKEYISSDKQWPRDKATQGSYFMVD